MLLGGLTRPYFLHSVSLEQGLNLANAGDNSFSGLLAFGLFSERSASPIRTEKFRPEKSLSKIVQVSADDGMHLVACPLLESA